ncbi:MAG: SCO family protein [Gammaproteobacteria bacterium]|nr:SCO family protein [Gammaproteobacteria bacterium]
MSAVTDATATNVYIRRRRIIGVLLLVSMFSMAWVINAFLDVNRKLDIPLPLLSTLRPEPKPLSAFSLMDQFGKEFTLDRLRGKWSFIFFGYTACPDICPTTLTEMNKVAYTLVGEQAGKKLQESDFNFIFVSVDPKRDGVENMEKYTAYFNPEFIGLTGDQSQLDVLMQQLNILAVRENSATSGGYNMRHTSSIKLIDPRARWLASFSPPHDGDKIAKKFILVRDYYKQAR